MEVFMMSYRLLKPKFLVVVPIMVLLALAVACGDDAAVPTPTPIDVNAITTRIQQALQDTLKDVTAGAVTKSDIDNAVATAISAIPDPPTAVSAQEIQTMVSAAVTAAIPEEASADEIRKLVTDAVTAATSGAVTQQDVAQAISQAVAEAAANAPEPLSEADIQSIVQAALPTATPIPTPTPTVAAMAPGPFGELSAAYTEMGVYGTHPRLTPGTVGLYVMQANGEGLFTLNANGDSLGKVAKGWSIAADGLNWTIELNEGVQFHQGYGEVTAEDVIWSLLENTTEDTLSSYKSPYTSLFANEAGSITATDDYNIAVNTGTPQYDLVNQLSGAAGGWIFSKRQSEELGAEVANHQGALTGPWEPEEIKNGEFWRFSAVEDHWRKTPEFANLVLWEIPEESTRLANFQTGRLSTFLMEFDSLPVVEGIIGVEFMEMAAGVSSSLRFYGMWHDVDRPGFDPTLPWVSGNADVNSVEWQNAVKVRRALSIAIDRQAIIDTLLRGRGVNSVLWVFEGNEFRLDPEKRQWPYDPDRARELLTEAGYPDGFSITLHPAIRNVPAEVEACDAIASAWEEIGVDVDVLYVPFGTIRPPIVAREFVGATCHATTGRLDPLSLWNILYKTTTSFGIGFEIPELQRMMERATAAIDPDERWPLVVDIAHYMYDNALEAGLYGINIVWPLNPGVGSWEDRLEHGSKKSLSAFEWATHR
jgi:peptide/nickel transport system substrate-binding protein